MSVSRRARRTTTPSPSSPPCKALRFTSVSGNVRNGSILRAAGRVDFVLEEQGRTVPVTYVGRDPLPDTFKDGAQALVEGRMKPDGRFEAEQIQAKCASKYEATPNQAPGVAQPGQTSNNVPGGDGKS